MSLEPAQTVFVTGGSGHIGRNILRSLTQAGLCIRAFARSAASADVVT